ncbi:MAG: ribosome maturation factor RimM [Propionibacteriaceae bacterium]|nr:ribosome maturation factor RimM [Propionibacteriaceae bacterium]
MKDVIVGRIGKPHGLAGEVAIQVVTDEPEFRFAVGKKVVTDDGAVLTVRAARNSNGTWLLRFAELADRTAVEARRGQTLWAEAYEISEPDTYHASALVGFTVLRAGEPVGTVTRVLSAPAQDLLEIETPAGERLVPFVKALVPEVNVDARTLEVADMEGLI